MPGPPRKKQAARRRRNKDGIETEVVNIDELVIGEVEIPIANPDWEPLTVSFYESFMASGQSLWMEPTDWMTAYSLMEILDRWLKPQDIQVGEREVLDPEKPYDDKGATNKIGKDLVFEKKVIAMPGGTLNAILKGLSSLLATEGDRRRLRIELERRKAIDAALSSDGVVVSITQNREDVFKRQARG